MPDSNSTQNIDHDDGPATPPASSRNKFRLGVAVKVVGLAVLPVLAMAALNLVSSNQTQVRVFSTLNDLEQTQSRTAQMNGKASAIKDRTAELTKKVAAMVQAQQTALLTRSVKTGGKVRSLRSGVTKEIATFDKQINGFGKMLADSGMLARENAGDINARRLNFLIRRADNLTRQFKMYATSGDRTFALIARRRYDEATNNLRFEENFRLAPIIQSVDKISAVLNDLVTGVSAMHQGMSRKKSAVALAGIDELAQRNLWLLIIGAVILIALAGAYARLGLARHLKRLAKAMDELSVGDTTVEIPKVSRDEIGDMAVTVQVFKDNLINMAEMRRDQAEADGKAEEARLEAGEEQRAAEERAQTDKREAMFSLADDFENRVKSVVEGVSQAASQMQATAGSMSATAAETNRQAQAVATASEQTTGNVQNVASAAEQLSSAVDEISRQVSHSSEIATGAVEEAERTDQIVQGLNGSAQKIGEVVNLINDIANQTNLLALNATIEAARAGEAGKGFAVVASEVKNLANQTAKATEEIGSQISAMQAETAGAVEAIRGIGQTVGQINEIATAISSAVEEQGAATANISRNVQDAAQGTQEVSANIASVTEAAGETGTAATSVLDAAKGLSDESAVLEEQVTSFVEEIRSA